MNLGWHAKALMIHKFFAKLVIQTYLQSNISKYRTFSLHSRNSFQYIRLILPMNPILQSNFKIQNFFFTLKEFTVVKIPCPQGKNCGNPMFNSCTMLMLLSRENYSNHGVTYSGLSNRYRVQKSRGRLHKTRNRSYPDHCLDSYLVLHRTYSY